MRQSIVLAAVLAFSVAGCVAEDESESSSLEIPLLQNGNDGALYRLTASFEITAADGTATLIAGTADEPSVGFLIAPGAYGVRLVDGWTLHRSQDGTSFEQVDATLGSQNPQSIHVFADTVHTVSFRFYVRSGDATVIVGFGVVPDPQQLLGTLSFTSATGNLAPYVGRTVDYDIFFDPTQQGIEIASDTTKLRRYAARQIAADFSADPIGLFTGPLGALVDGGSLDMTIRVATDGTQQLDGTVLNVVGVPLRFGPATVSVPVDTDGFPTDAAFDVVAPFTLTSPTSTAAGTVTVRHDLH